MIDVRPFKRNEICNVLAVKNLPYFHGVLTCKFVFLPAVVRSSSLEHHAGCYSLSCFWHASAIVFIFFAACFLAIACSNFRLIDTGFWQMLRIYARACWFSRSRRSVIRLFIGWSDMDWLSPIDYICLLCPRPGNCQNVLANHLYYRMWPVIYME